MILLSDILVLRIWWDHTARQNARSVQLFIFCNIHFVERMFFYSLLQYSTWGLLSRILFIFCALGGSFVNHCCSCKSLLCCEPDAYISEGVCEGWIFGKSVPIEWNLLLLKFYVPALMSFSKEICTSNTLKRFCLIKCFNCSLKKIWSQDWSWYIAKGTTDPRHWELWHIQHL